MMRLAVEEEAGRVAAAQQQQGAAGGKGSSKGVPVTGTVVKAKGPGTARCVCMYAWAGLALSWSG